MLKYLEALPTSRRVQLELTVVVTLHALLFLGLVPAWVIAITSALLAWKFWVVWRGLDHPPRWLVSGVGALVLGLVAVSQGTLLGDVAATMGLVMISGCKLLESDRYRDAVVTVILCFALLMAHLLFSQSLLSTFWLGIDVFLLVQFLFRLHPGQATLFSLRVLGRLLLAIVPIWILFFAVFPRFSVGLWNRDPQSARSGFSEELDPGSISRLVQSNEIAFRFQVSSKQKRELSQQQLYFRGAVYTENHGLHWSKGRTPVAPALVSPEARSGEDIPSVEIFLEPTGQRWMFLLDYWARDQMPLLRGNPVKWGLGQSFESEKPMVSRVSYEHRFRDEPGAEGPLSAAQKSLYLRVPKAVDPQVAELVASWRREIPQAVAAERVQQVLKWFASQSFQYTLNPGTTPSLEAFLFKTRRGFCEHFAAAGADLLRRLEVPARVVVGYQGAEKNSYTDHYMVRQKHAHAWVEWWEPLVTGVGDSAVQGGRWRRLDLVGGVVPLRIERGSEFFDLAVGAGGRVDESRESEWARRFRRLSRVWTQAWDAAEMSWIAFLMNYDFEAQQQWLSKFGIQVRKTSDLWKWLGVFLALAFGVLWIFLRRRLRSKDKIDPVLIEWRKLKQKWIVEGVPIVPSDTPSRVLQKLNQYQPAHPFGPIIQDFEGYRYRTEQLGQSLYLQIKKLRQQR